MVLLKGIGYGNQLQEIIDDNCDCASCTVIKVIHDCMPLASLDTIETIYSKLDEGFCDLLCGPNGHTLLKMKMARGEI